MQEVAEPRASVRSRRLDSIRAHLQICRFDHWFKNVFVLPGIAVALSVDPERWRPGLLIEALLGLLAIGLVASSNYVVNELRDAPFDRHHPVKRNRPVPSGRVHVPLAYVQWIALGVLGVSIGWGFFSPGFTWTLVALWVMGCLYNLRPVRTKDVPYLDVLSEAVNNPLRLLAGWYIVDPNAIAPASLVLSYWMIGAYFMAMKRFAEYRGLDPAQAASYRRSFAYYDEASLLVSVMFYASASMLLLGAFIMRYRLSLILATPFVALVMALYMRMGLEENSPVQNPERLYRQPGFVVATTVCAVVLVLCLLYDVPILSEWFAPTAPTSLGGGP